MIEKIDMAFNSNRNLYNVILKLNEVIDEINKIIKRQIQR
jgi:hypothetical protein